MNFLLLLVAGCTLADAGNRDAPRDADPQVDELPFDELVYVDVRGSMQAMEMVHGEVLSLSPQARAEIRESMGFLVRNCPYTRASVQLPRAMRRVADEMPLGEVDAFVQTDWLHLRRGLGAHVATFDAMGATLPLLEMGDALYRQGDPIWLADDVALAEAADPLDVTLGLLERVDDLVDELDPATRELIRFHTDRVDQHLGHSWNLRNHLVGWNDALKRMDPFLTEQRTKRSVGRMQDMLATHGGQGC